MNMRSNLRRTLAIVAPLAAALVAGCAQLPEGAIAVARQGSFFVGGRTVVLDGVPPAKTPAGLTLDQNGAFMVEPTYVAFQVPAERRAPHALVMVHGGGHTGAVYESTPDGREGWATTFLRWGHAVHVVDLVERGRAGFARVPQVWKESPVHLSKREAWETFRLGPPKSWADDPGSRRAHPGSQFPVSAFDDYSKQLVPRWLPHNALLTTGLEQVVERVGPSVLLTHSQSGPFGWEVAKRRPSLVKGIVAIEPSRATLAAADLPKLAGIPVLIVWGDFVPTSPLWSRFAADSEKFAADLRAAGADVTVLRLPEHGIAGNTHLPMLDLNSAAVARAIQDWMVAKKLAGG